MVFVVAMLTTALGGFTIAVVGNVAPAVNVPAAALTSYLVITSLATVRPRAAASRPLHVAALVLAMSVSITSLTFAAQAVANGGTRNGMPAFPFVLFGTIALLGSVGDVRVLRSGALTGSSRLARHLWRMSFALFIAALSFFIGQAKVIPQPIRIRPLLGLPVLSVLVTMLYWLWRVRSRRSVRELPLISVGARAAR
ncbi:MAG: hypothetical protein ACT4PJ_03890 [Gemmatimonadaceae bacterium]